MVATAATVTSEILGELQLRISEKKFTGETIAAAQNMGYLAYHTWNSQHSQAGFPDLVLVNEQRRRLVIAELKTEKGKLSAMQIVWLSALKAIGLPEVYVWRPRNWEEIAYILYGHGPTGFRPTTLWTPSMALAA